MKKLLAILGIGLSLLFFSVASAATFGNTTEETGGFVTDDDLIGTIYTLSEDGTVTKVSAYMAIAIDNADNQALSKVSIYDASDDSFIASSTTQTITGQTRTLYEFTFNQALTAGDYWLLISSADDSDQVLGFQVSDAGVVAGRQQNLGTFPALPDPWTPGADIDRKFAIFATYTPDSPTVTTNTTMSNINLSNVIIK